MTERKTDGTILIVDDIPENLKILAHMLKDKGFSITVAQSGREALERIHISPPDLVLLDISMPEMSGYEVCEKIKSSDATSSIPVIFITALDSPQDIVTGFEKGAVDYLTRPVNSAELNARISTHLELKNSKDIIEQQNRELKELNASKDKFLSILAHDLKNPIAGLITISELIIKMYDSLEDSERQSYITEINTAAKRIQNILEDLLQWSRSQSGRIEYLPETINISKVTQDVLAALERFAEKKKITIQLDISDEQEAFADRNMIATVIRNLLSNAIKFTHEGGIITLSADQNDMHVIYKVADTGIGISKQNLNKLFHIDSGLSTPGTLNERGTGLGLILCKEFVEKNKGIISVESSEGKGSVFQFTLPKAE